MSLYPVLDGLLTLAVLWYGATLWLLARGRTDVALPSIAGLLVAGGACAAFAWQTTAPCLWALSGLSGVALWPTAL